MAKPRWLDEREAHLWRHWLRLNQELPNVLEAHPGHVAATRRYFFDLLSDEEVDVLAAVYERVLANLETR